MKKYKEAEWVDEEWVKMEKLRKCYDFIQSQIEARDLMAYMYEKGSLTYDDMDEINNTPPPTRKTRASVLLGKISTVTAYDIFTETLRQKGYVTVVEKLETIVVDKECGAGDTVRHPKIKAISKLLEVKIERAKKVFVETKSFRVVKAALERHAYVTITGGPGSGKTTMALMLMDEYRQRDHIVMFIENLENLDSDKILDIRYPKLLVIDDVMGSVAVLQDRIVVFNKLFDFLADLLENYNSTLGDSPEDFQNEKNIKVIFTSKTWLLKESKYHIKQHLYKYFTESVVDLSNSKMSEQELKDILSRHLTRRDQTLCPKDVSKICTNILKEGETAVGFPYICQLFSSQDVFTKIKDPVEFFKNPLTFLETELNRLFETDKKKKACFILMVLCDGNLNLTTLMNFSARQSSILNKKVKLVQDNITLSNDSIQQFCHDIKTTAELLKDTFLKIEDDNVSFLHASTHDAAAYLLGKENIDLIITHCSMKVINERIRTKVGSIKRKTNEDSSDFLITISEANYPLLAERLALELCNKYFAASLSHQAFGNMKVKKQIFDILSEKKELEILIHSCDKEYEAHFLFWAALFNHPNLLNRTLSLDTFTTDELLWGILAACVNGKSDCFDMITSKDPHVNEQLINKTVTEISNFSNKGIKGKSEFQNYFKLTSSSYLEFKGTCSLIHVASAFGHKVIVQKLLEIGDCVNNMTESGVTPLMLASLHGHQDLVDLLLDQSADYRLKSKGGNNSLHFACLGNQVDVIERLCQLDIDINCPGRAHWTPLLYSCRYGHLKVVKLLLSKSADTTKTTDSGMNGLHLACCNGNEEIVEMFLSEGLDVNCVTSKLKTPLMYASFEGQIHIANMLLEKCADVTKQDALGRSCLHYACFRSKNYDLIEKLLACDDINIDCKSDKGWTPLCYASHFGYVEVINLLLSHGADKNVVVDDGLNCLHLAAQGGSVKAVDIFLRLELNVESETHIKETPFLLSCIQDQIEVVQCLIENDANIYACDSYGRNALHLACKSGHLNVPEFLLDEGGMNVNSKDKIGWTPLLFASRYGNVDLIELLLSRQADVNLVIHSDLSCLHLACCHGDADKVDLLLSKGLDINSKTDKGKTPLMYCCEEGMTSLIDKLVACGADLSVVDNEGNNCLYYALVQKNNEELISKLIEHKMDINKEGESGWTPLLFLSRYGSKKSVEILLENGADATAVSTHGLNCLHMAACNSDIHMTEIFIGLGFDINCRSKKKKTPLMYACAEGNVETAMVLIFKGVSVLARDGTGKTCYDWLDKDKYRDFAEKLEHDYPELTNIELMSQKSI